MTAANIIDILVVIVALVMLMVIAYRGYSVILFAPVVAMGAVLCFEPISVFPAYMTLFMDKAAFFMKTYFPMFLLGAIFGKVIELSGFSKSIVTTIFKWVGVKHSMLAICLVTAVLAYGGVSMFVLVFAVYPLASEMFKMGKIPKRLIPGIIWLGMGTFAMDALPGTPQIQNIIPTTFFGTTAYAAPILGLIGSAIILTAGMVYFELARRKAVANNEGYGSGRALVNEPETTEDGNLPNMWIAVIPLLVVAILNFVLTETIVNIFGETYVLHLPGMKEALSIDVTKNVSLWAVVIALIAGVLTTFALAFKPIVKRFADGSKQAVSGALLAIMNTASEYGYGSIIAVLPGFLIISNLMHHGISNPLLSEIISISALAGIVGSASGGLSIALAAMSDVYISSANAAGIPLEVAHRIASMASGAFDSLPHNGAVITLLAVTGLSHKHAYGPIFVITLIKTVTVFAVMGIYYLTGLV